MRRRPSQDAPERGCPTRVLPQHGSARTEHPRRLGLRWQSAAATPLSPPAERNAAPAHLDVCRFNWLFSLAPGFSRVFASTRERNRFNGFALSAQPGANGKPLKRLSLSGRTNTRLKPGANERSTGVKLLSLLALAVLLALLCACRTAPPARIDTSSPGWTQRSGQAVWTPARGAAEVVIDLQVWHRADGECLLDVSKAALSFVLAHVTADYWRIEAASGQRHAARGTPPARLGWLQLARALASQPPVAPWQFERRAPGAWRFTNPQTGERFDGSLSP